MKVTKEGMINFAKERKYMGFIQIIIGIILFLIRQIFFQSIVVVLGGVILAFSIIFLLVVLRRPKELISGKSFISPVLLMIIGACLLVFPSSFIEIVVIIIGICIILKGIANLFNTYYGNNKNYFIVSNIVNIVFGILILFFRNSADSFFVIFLALEFIFSGVVDILISINANKYIKSNDDGNIIDM